MDIDHFVGFLSLNEHLICLNDPRIKYPTKSHLGKALKAPEFISGSPLEPPRGVGGSVRLGSHSALAG